MFINTPRLHNFSDSTHKTILEEAGCESVQKWEISVQPEDDVAWSVVLSYLISTSYKANLPHNLTSATKQKLSNIKYYKNFSKRLMQLTGSKTNVKLVKRAIESFNPFINKYSCFYNETLKQVVEEFKENFDWHHLTNVSEKMKTVSTILNCSIVDLRKVENNTESYIYSKIVKNNQNMIVFYCDYTGERNVFNFMLDYELGLKMKTAALLHFLKEAKMSRREMLQIKSVTKEGKHFLISLLTNNCQDIIPKLYKSAYVISKLAEAGYETDPKTRGVDGLSALYHALVHGDEKTLSVLYYFAANNCFQSECSYRNPDCSIVNNLNQMEKILLDDLHISENHPNYDDLQKKSKDLLGFNNFLQEVTNKIINIKNETAKDTQMEACQRREIILYLLNTYQNFFKRTPEETTKLSPLDDYIMFNTYYKLIDQATAIIFFDNIVFLKERLALKDNSQFSEIESSLLFSVMYYVVFERIVTNVNLDSFKRDKKGIKRLYIFHELKGAFLNEIQYFDSFNKKSLYIFPLTRRLENITKIKEFSTTLRDTKINKTNVLKRFPRGEIENILKSYPQFKDGLQLFRLKGYLNTAVNVKVSDVKSVLVIQRALQAIGEYIKPDKDDEYSFKRFLTLMLPQKVCQILRRTRDELSHVENYAFKPKVKYEKNVSMFRLIQKEIHKIKYHFEPVFQTQDVYGSIVVINALEKQLEQIKEQSYLYTSSALYSSYILDSIRIYLIEFRNFLFYKHTSTFKELLKTILCRIENDILKDVNWSVDWGNLKNDILFKLGPLKWTIELLQEFGEESAKILLKEYEKLNTCNPDTHSIDDPRNMTNNFLAKCKELPSLIKISRRERVISPLEQIPSIQQFLKILKGFTYLSDEVKDHIRKEIPDTIRRSIANKEKLVKSIENGFSIDIKEITPEFELSHLSNTKKNLFWKLYKNKTPEALNILKTPDPITELEEIFSKNSVDKKKYETLCWTMQFSDKSKTYLERLVAGQNIKVPGNNLSHLLNRVQLLKKILIEENEEVLNLWMKAKQPTDHAYIVDKIVWYYLRDNSLQAAVEMLLLDCMSIYEKEKSIENPWIKSSKLYCGINMRNVLSHGSPLLEYLCFLLDPEDLPSDQIKKILRHIEDEDIIKAILELYEQVGSDYSKLQLIINNDVNSEYIDIKNRILKNGLNWKSYALLLPSKMTINQT